MMSPKQLASLKGNFLAHLLPLHFDLQQKLHKTS